MDPMRTTSKMLLLGLMIAFGGTASAQTVDLGRGELPLHVPSGYSAGTPAPLVVLLHGYGSSGAGQESYMKFGELVDSHGFLLVYPDGTPEATGRNARFWNASKACCNFGGSTVDDSGYVLDIINEVKSRYSIDPNRVYLIGHSNGGFMSYRAAYDHSNTIAAITSLAGAASSDDRGPPSNPVHILQIHGTDDSTIAYAGADIGGASYPGAVETVERWAAYNGCSDEGAVQDRPLDLEREIAGPETTVTRYVQGCTAGGSSELWTIAAGSHVPQISDTFSSNIIEWLLAHPKP
jgi:polyhydroxybutyrate depolymerase